MSRVFLPLALCLLHLTEDTDLDRESEHPKSAVEARIASPYLIEDFFTFEVAFEEWTVDLPSEEIEDGSVGPRRESFS